MMTARKPVLVPVEVPWRVDSATPFLRLIAWEMGQPTEVNLVAHFGLEERQSFEALGSETVGVVAPPDYDRPAPEEHQGPYKLIKLTFDSAQSVRMSHSYADDQVIDESGYDWSRLKCLYKPGQSIQEFRQVFWDEWFRTGICPSPRMFEVEGSSWLEETGLAAHGYKHYIILGHDAYIEVIAHGFTWSLL